MSGRVILGEQFQGRGEGRRVIGIELRIAPGPGQQQEEVFMDGLDILLPYGYTQLEWSVTLHTTNGDVTCQSRYSGADIRF